MADRGSPDRSARWASPNVGTRLKYRPDIDGLRAVAVLAVLAFHANPAWLPGGFVGVDVFFVISGFLISTIIFGNLATNSFSFFQFYSRRIRRIFPPLIVLLISCLVAGWFVLLPGEYAKLGQHATYACTFILNVVLNREAEYFDAASETKPLMHIWSLCIEEQFYIIWPFMLVLTWRVRKHLFVFLMIGFLVSFYSSAINTRMDPSSAFFLGQNRFWELLIGAAMAHVRVRASARANGLPPSNKGTPLPTYWARCLDNVSSAIGLALLLGAFLVVRKDRPFPGFWALLPTTAAWLILRAGPDAWVNRNVLANRVLTSIGQFSYPLYLWHWPLLSFGSILQYGQPSGFSKLAALSVSFPIAWCSDRLLERPIRSNNREGISPRLLPVSLIFALGTIAMIGARISYHNGYAGRFRREDTRPPTAPSFPPASPLQGPSHSTDVNVVPHSPGNTPGARIPTVNVGGIAPRDKSQEGSDAANSYRPLRPFVRDLRNYGPSATEILRTWRIRDCFLDPEQKAESFAPGCVDQEPADRQLILLWGDSNAASLAPGLQDLQKRWPFRLAVQTASACPPVLGFDREGRPNCRSINDSTYQRLSFMKPAIILLAAQAYAADAASLEALRASVDAIAATTRRVILVGPSPRYAVTLPSYVGRKFLEVPDAAIPRRDKLPMDDEAMVRDRQFAGFAKNNNIEYYSIIDRLCGSSGCIIRVPYDQFHDDIVQFDGTHLTEAGSRFVVEGMAPMLSKRH